MAFCGVTVPLKSNRNNYTKDSSKGKRSYMKEQWTLITSTYATQAAYACPKWACTSGKKVFSVKLISSSFTLPSLALCKCETGRQHPSQAVGCRLGWCWQHWQNMLPSADCPPTASSAKQLMQVKMQIQKMCWDFINSWSLSAFTHNPSSRYGLRENRNLWQSFVLALRQGLN